MAFGMTRISLPEYDEPQGPDPGTVRQPQDPVKPYTKPPVIIRRELPVSAMPPVYYTDPAIMIAAQPQSQSFQFTPMQLLIGGILLYLLLKG